MLLGRPWLYMVGVWVDCGEKGKQGQEQEPDRIKNIVSPSDYEKVKVDPGRVFLVRKSMSAKERITYMKFPKEYLDVFAWGFADLRGILPK